MKQIEPAHDKTYDKTCVTSKDSDQPVQCFLFIPLWIARGLFPHWIAQGILKVHAISEDSDQSARMRRLI